MSAKIEFTAISPEGKPVTRTSGTMPYVAVVFGDNETWHKTFAAAHKAAVSREHTYSSGKPGKVVPAVPTKIVGKLGDWTPEVDGWGDIPASAFTELVAAKAAPKAKPVEESNTVIRDRVRRNAKKLAGAKTTAQVVADIIAEDAATEVAPEGKKATKKQELGAMVHAAARAALMAHDLPAGMTREEAEAQLTTWLQYIPNGARAAGTANWQARQAKA